MCRILIIRAADSPPFSRRLPPCLRLRSKACVQSMDVRCAGARPRTARATAVARKQMRWASHPFLAHLSAHRGGRRSDWDLFVAISCLILKRSCPIIDATPAQPSMRVRKRPRRSGAGAPHRDGNLLSTDREALEGRRTTPAQNSGPLNAARSDNALDRSTPPRSGSNSSIG
jgi:hypothetical protein